MLLATMSRSAASSFELANRVLHEKAPGSETPAQMGAGQRSHLAREQSNRAKESQEAHSGHLGRAKKFVSDASENVALGRKRKRKRDTAKLRAAGSKKRIP